MMIRYVFCFILFAYLRALQSHAHAGHIHSYVEGCPASIFAGPIVGDYAYFLDWSSEMVFASIRGLWTIEKTWQLRFSRQASSNMAMTKSWDGSSVILFHYISDDNVPLKYYNFDYRSSDLVDTQVGQGCPAYGQPKARTIEGRIFLLDMAITTGSAVFEFNTDGTCTALDNANITLKNRFLGASNGVLPWGGTGPQEALYTWSFDVRILESGYEFFFLSRDSTGVNDFKVFTYKTQSSQLSSWDDVPLASTHYRDVSKKYPDPYGDIFYVGPGENVVVLQGQYRYHKDWSVKDLTQNMNYLEGKMFLIENRTVAHICGVGLRHPYHNQYDRVTAVFTIGDVGEDDIEELNIAQCSQFTTPHNFGFPLLEGYQFYDKTVNLEKRTSHQLPRLVLEHCKDDHDGDALGDTEYILVWTLPLGILSFFVVLVRCRYANQKKILMTLMPAYILAVISWSLPALYSFKMQDIEYNYGVWYGSSQINGIEDAFEQIDFKYGVRPRTKEDASFILAVVQTLLLFSFLTPVWIITFGLSLAVPLLMESLYTTLSDSFDKRGLSYTLAWASFLVFCFTCPWDQIQNRWYWAGNKVAKPINKKIGQLIF